MLTDVPLMSTNFLKSGFRKQSKEIEIEYLKSANFIDKAIESFCDIEIKVFGYQRPYWNINKYNIDLYISKCKHW